MTAVNFSFPRCLSQRLSTVLTFIQRAHDFNVSACVIFSCVCSSHAESSLFFTKVSIVCYLLLYVDTVTINDSDNRLISGMIICLSQEFWLCDLGSLLYLLGIQKISQVISCSHNKSTLNNLKT